MLPIAHAVLQEMDKQSKEEGVSTEHETTPNDTSEAPRPLSNADSEAVSLVKARYVKVYNGTSDEDNEEVSLEGVSESQEVETNFMRLSKESDGRNHGNQDSVRHCDSAPVADVPQTSSGGCGRLGKGLVLGIAYSANIGGTATLTGTGPNLVFSGYILEYVTGITQSNLSILNTLGPDYRNVLITECPH